MTSKTDLHVITVPVELRSETRSDGGLRLAGTALIYNSVSGDLGFREVLLPGSAGDALGRAKDLLLLWQHDTAKPLARLGAGLRAWETARGVEFTADLPPTQLAKDAHVLVKSGVVRGMSFAFNMDGGEDAWSIRNSERFREISKIGNLVELSLVTEPAYRETNVDARAKLAREIDAIPSDLRAQRAERERLAARERSSYGPGSLHSFFRDLLVIAESDKRKQLALANPYLRGRDPLRDTETGRHDGTPDDARRRLASIEERALSNVAGQGGEFLVPHGVPDFVADEFVRSITATAVIAPLLRPIPLPDSGFQVEAPVFSTGPSVAGQTSESAADSNTDPTTSLVGSEIWTAAGHIDVSRQFFDRATPATDVAIAGELGAKFAAALDAELLNGPASTSLRLCGFLNVPNKTSYTYTSGAPTAAEFVAKLGEMAAQVATAFAVPGSSLVAVMHPRRRMHVEFKAVLPNGWPIRPFACPSIPTTLGAGTNQDVVIVLDPAAFPIALGEVRFRAMGDTSASANLQVRLQVYGYVAALTTRQPKALGVMNGTGLVPPTW